MDKFEIFVRRLDADDVDFHIVGDLNCNLMDTTNNQHTRRLIEIIDTYQLKQIIQDPTRVTKDSQSLIDLFITNKVDKISNFGVIPVGISDHNLIFASIKIALKRSKPKVIQSRNFKKYNKINFCSELANNFCTLDFSSKTDPNDMWNDWKTVFTNIADKHAPYTTRRVKSTYTPWLTSEVKREMYHRDYLRKKSIQTGSNHYHIAYKKARNRVNKIVVKTKSEYYLKNITQNKHNPKELWKNINQLRGKGSKTTTITSLHAEGKTISNKLDIAETFNNHFINVGSDLSQNLPDSKVNFTSYVSPVESTFEFGVITLSDVLKLLSSAKCSKASGPDKISTRLIKDSADIISPSLCILFNSSLSSGIFPEDWKNALVSPIYKTGDKLDCGNFRPISVLSVIAKLFEKIVFKQLIRYLDGNNILTQHQFGFRKSHSTLTSLLNATNNWLVNIDEGLINGVLFLDLRKAFDTVDHQILISKLNSYGITDKPLKWFKSYLNCRKQSCKVNNVISSNKEIRCGVPQGSNLGPLLFLLYINDLPNCLVYSKPSMFADDTNVTVTGNCPEQIRMKLNSDLTKIHDWLVANKLTLNVSKTEYMIIGSRNQITKVTEDPNITIDGKSINRVKSTKSLGVIIDEKLNWEKHIDSVSKKVSKSIGAIKLIKPYIPKENLIDTYNALVKPYFDYCSLVWGNCGVLLQLKLQKLQNRAARVISGENYEIRSTDILKKLNWYPLNFYRLEQMLVLMHKILNNDAPKAITELFQISENQVYNLRSNNNMLMLSKPRLNAMKRSFSYEAAKVWNALPLQLKNTSLTINEFKTKLGEAFKEENCMILNNLKY